MKMDFSGDVMLSMLTAYFIGAFAVTYAFHLAIVCLGLSYKYGLPQSPT